MISTTAMAPRQENMNTLHH